jgi:glyoxylase-like metal-dependent hydrolase (beta-lactamase superfamily II)
MDRFTTSEGHRIIALCDGTVGFGAEVFPGFDKAAFDARFPDGKAPSAFNAFVILAPGQTPVLVDCGGGHLDPMFGGLIPALRAEGLTPADIGTLFLTHLHADHCGGALDRDGAPVFPTARVLLHRAEAAHWAGAETPGGRFLVAYQSRITPCDDGAGIAPGVTLWPLPGHTPGHSGLLIGTDAALAGDIIHAETLQLADPAIGTRYDVDPDRARLTRRAALNRLASEGRVWGGGHILWPAPLTRITAAGAGFARQPPGVT